MSTDTMTLKNQDSSVSAVIRYPAGSSGYPLVPKTFTKHQLADGSYAYDMPTNPLKRRWEMLIDGEDSGDNLYLNLVLLYLTSGTLYLDIDIDTYLMNENDIPVVFEDFQPIPVVGSVFQYRVVLQEI